MAELTTSPRPVGMIDDGEDALSPRRRLLGWSHSSLPVAPLLLVGLGLGPQGLHVLTPAVLDAIDPAVPVALAALGCLLGLELPPRAAYRWTAVAAAVVQGIVTTALVAVALLILARIGSTPFGPLWLWSVSAGLCAASSWVPPSRDPSQLRRRDEWTVALETMAALLIGAGIGAASRASSMSGAAGTFVQSVAIILVVAAAGWLLVRHTTSSTEGRVFAVGSVLIVGGMADYLAVSPLLGGLAAGAFWQVLGGSSRETLHREVRYAHHPFVVLASIVAGALADVTPLVLGLAAGYACVRLVARLLSPTLLHWTVPARAARPPVAAGLMSIALVLTLQRTLGADHTLGATLLSVVVLGTILADTLGRVASSGRHTP